MTNKEAIDWFKNNAFYHKDHGPFNMAISALEKENIYDDKEHYVTISKALYDKLNVDACDDAISREYLVEHIKACWTNGRPRYSPDLSELLSWIDDVPPVQPKPIECDDAISREDAINRIARTFSIPKYEVSDCLSMLPSVQPIRKGHWIRWREDFEYIERGVTESVPHCQCSECKKEYDPHTTQFINFCPNCGADMRESEVSE